MGQPISTALLLALLAICCTTLDGRELSQQPRIYGGTGADPRRFPYFVTLLRDKDRPSEDELQLACGGTLLSRDVILTAAHCTVATTVEWGRGLGMTSEAGVQRREVKQIRVHPEYMPKFYDMDVGLLKVDSPFTGVEDFVQLVDDGHLDGLEDPTYTVIGRGKQELLPWFINLSTIMDQSESFDEPIKEIRIRKVKTSVCRRTYNNPPLYVVVTDNMMCASAPGQDSCLGDSGGPLLLKGASPGEDIQVGLVSWGDECGSKKYPGVYHRLSRSVRWVNETLHELLDDNGSAGDASYTDSEAGLVTDSRQGPDKHAP